MRVRGRHMTPLAAVIGGFLAGAAGTICLDARRYLTYRREGGDESPVAWEFAPIEGWDQAPEPGQVTRRLIEGFTRRPLPDRRAWLVSTVTHWAYGSLWGACYGILAGSLRRPRPQLGLPFGALVWLTGYIVLPEGGLYKPIWEYDPETLARDLGAHLAYGSGTATSFWLLAPLLRRQV